MNNPKQRKSVVKIQKQTRFQRNLLKRIKECDNELLDIVKEDRKARSRMSGGNRNCIPDTMLDARDCGLFWYDLRRVKKHTIKRLKKQKRRLRRLRLKEKEEELNR